MKNRREFIRGTIRTALLAAAGCGVVWGIRKRKITAEARAACEVSPGCQGCGKLGTCSKEQAEEFRGTGSKENGKGN